MQFREEVRGALPRDGGDGTGIGNEAEFQPAVFGDANALGERPREVPANDRRQRGFAAAARVPGGQRRVGGKNALQ